MHVSTHKNIHVFPYNAKIHFKLQVIKLGTNLIKPHTTSVITSTGILIENVLHLSDVFLYSMTPPPPPP